MKQIKLILLMVISAIVVQFSRYNLANNVIYKKFADGFNCPIAYLLFDTAAQSAISCSHLCEIISDCIGFEHNRDTGVCRGCLDLANSNCTYEPPSVASESVIVYTKGQGFLVSGILPVAENSLTASTEYRYDTLASYGRYCMGSYFWSAKHGNIDQWIQTRLLRTAVVSAIYLKPTPRAFYQFVKSFKLMYSEDCSTLNPYTHQNGTDMILPGITAEYIPVTTVLPEIIQAQCVRINPVTWVTHIALQFDVIGFYP